MIARILSGVTGFEVVLATLHKARLEVEQTSAEIAAERQQVDASVHQLLAQGWSGAAATSYGQAWSDWVDGADEVVAGLRRLGDALSLAHRDYLARDDAARQLLANSGQGLGSPSPYAAGNPADGAGSGLNMGGHPG